MDNLLHFEAGFENTSSEDWKAAISKDLKGITFEDLTSTDRNGIDIAPFYTATDTQLSFDKNPDWYIMDRIEATDAKEANTLALELLNSGITGLHLVCKDAVDLERLLADIDLKYIHLHLEYDGIDFTTFQSDVNLYVSEKYNQDTDTLSIQVSCSAPFTINKNSIHINAAIYNNAGANSVLENASIIAQLNEALHQASPESLATIETVYISVAVDTWFFEQIAKLRALRYLVTQVLKGYSVKPRIFIAANTSMIYLASIDYYNNVLRNALAGMAATIGGADSLYIHDFVTSKEQQFTRRISRNQQLIFKEEAHLDLVADKSKGAYFIENYSQSIAEKAWTQFQDIENTGGWNAVLQNQNLATWIQSQAAALLADYKNGSKLLIGVNKYKMSDPEIATCAVFPTTFGIEAINIQEAIAKE